MTLAEEETKNPRRRAMLGLGLLAVCLSVRIPGEHLSNFQLSGVIGIAA